ncbi:MAG: ComF family protein [Dermatophilaceae bacterium]
MLDPLRLLRDLVWPASCAACGAPGQALCAVCAIDIAGTGHLRAHSPTPPPPGFPPTLTWGSYEGALRRLVVAHKDEDRSDACSVLAELLADVVEAAIESLATPVLVPIPSSPASRRARGREPLLDLTRAMHLSATVPLLPVLRVVKRVRDQAGLGQDERRDNLDGSMAVVPGSESLLSGHDVLLLDDVVTTGFTLAEAARALRSGAPEPVRSVRAAVICATQRRM